MDSLVLLILGAVWAAVLIPPLLRSRMENRPSSSVTDFRRQLNKLQNSVPPRAGNGGRSLARPLAQSPLHRPAAPGRPGLSSSRRHHGGDRSGPRRSDTAVAPRRSAPRRSPGPRRHGDPTAEQPRPSRRRNDDRMQRADRRTQVARHARPNDELMRRRRSNVLLALVILVGGSLFLAATTKETVMLYLFAVSFLGLCGYAFVLSQARSRESQAWSNDWMS